MIRFGTVGGWCSLCLTRGSWEDGQAEPGQGQAMLEGPAKVCPKDFERVF